MKTLLQTFPILVVGLAACGDSKPRHELFTPKPECMGDSIVPYMGTFPQVMNNIAIGSLEDGFDLDGDGKPDNKLSALGPLAGDTVAKAISDYEIVVPIEFFNMPSVAASSCVKFAVYIGAYDVDGDGDSKRPGVAGGDCNDKDPNIHPGAVEIPDNGIDDDCDSLADDDAQHHPNTTDTMDRDHDGQSVAEGDCDDTNPMIKRGIAEICGDGLDNDCDGVADHSIDAMGNDLHVCSPFDPARDISVDKASLDDTGNPKITYTSGTIDANNQLLAGPSGFSVNIPVMAGLNLDLELTGTTMTGTVGADGTISMGRLGGVVDVRTADTIRGLSVSQIGLTPDESLLDATFANILGDLIALPKDKRADVQKKYPGCKTPDIDVDGDGLEAFCSSNPDSKMVDVCIDGDGTEIHDSMDDNGNRIECTQAVDKDGKPRFVDGISAELNFATTRIHAIKPPTN